MRRLVWVFVLFGMIGCGGEPIKKTPTGSNNASSGNGAPNGVTEGDNASANNSATTVNNSMAEGPCARVDRQQLEFPGTQVGETAVRLVTLSNCGDQDLEIESLSIESSAFDASLVSESVARPGEPIEIEVRFAPQQVVEFETLLTIAHSASDDPVLIQLTGVGTDSSCVTSVARARNASTGGQFDTAVTAAPGNTVELDGSESSSPQGIVTYEWSMVAIPADSNVVLSSNTAASPVFAPDVPGNYRVRLQASDVQGTGSCAPAEVSITATGGDGSGSTNIALQVVWTTPGDTTPGDNDGSDLDLHWLHQNGTWNMAPFDCYWDNMSPDWGPAGDVGNPSLDLDDSAGEGPENINHSGLETGVVYSAGVYYYSDRTLGASYATVRLYVDDMLALEVRDQLLSRTGDFLHAFNFSIENGAVATTRIYAGFPN